MMLFSDHEISMMACPRCRGGLERSADRLMCGRCRVSYETRGRLADLSPWPGQAPGPEWARWRHKLDMLQEWRRGTWDGSRSADSRQREADRFSSRFFEFLGLPETITVLEIGCGSADLRRYLGGRRYWGLDPMMEVPAATTGDAGDDVFLRGVGEHLPIADSSLDAAILCETLDHCLDPGAVIREARRVLKPGGILGVMQNVRSDDPERGVPFHRRLRVRLGSLKSRLRGRRLVDAGMTKTCRLGREELFALVGSQMPIASSEACDQVIFVRACREERAAARAEARGRPR